MEGNMDSTKWVVFTASGSQQRYHSAKVNAMQWKDFASKWQVPLILRYHSLLYICRRKIPFPVTSTLIYIFTVTVLHWLHKLPSSPGSLLFPSSLSILLSPTSTYVQPHSHTHLTTTTQSTTTTLRMKLNAILLFSLMGLGLATPVTVDGNITARGDSTSLHPLTTTSNPADQL